MHHPIDTELEPMLGRGAELLRIAERVSVLTGAGVSAESGVATFRGAGGLWEGHRVEDVATPFAFQRDPGMVWRFYNQRRAQVDTVQPNPGHHALVSLEDRFGSDKLTVITQNVDGLHRAAGTRHLLELHGNIRRVRCTGCRIVEDRGTEALADLPKCAGCGSMLRPDIVWFHETLPEGIWEQAEEAAAFCNCFLVVGTSAIVYPAAGLIDVARAGGAKIIEVNLAKTDASHKVDVGLYGPSGQILPRLVERL